MKFSIITVCYNSVATIEKTIKSVVAQNLTDIEYIVVDGASTDGTIDIIRKYEQFITKWVSEPDKGIYDAMNKGISMSTGDVIAFINSDDWYVEGAFEAVCNAFNANVCDVVCGDSYVIWKDGKAAYSDASCADYEDMYITMQYHHSTLFAKREWFSMEDNFDLHYKIAADYDWILRIMDKGARLCYIHTPIFYFTYGGISSVNEIACAWEARNIALKHLTVDRANFKDKIIDRFRQVVERVIIQKRNEKIIEGDIGYLQAEFTFLNTGNPIYIWGAGKRSGKCIRWFKSAGLPLKGVIDGNKDKWGDFLEEVPIVSPNKIEKSTKLVVVISSEKYENEIREQISTIHWSHLAEIYSVRQLEELILEQELEKWSSIA